jgi:cytochrome c oxidase subunit IV
MSSHSADAPHGPGMTAKGFCVVWVLLLVLTAVEVFLAYEQVPLMAMLVALVGLSLVKAVLIIAYFMHLRFEKISLFYTLFPMLIFCILLMFIAMPDAVRALELRPK